MHTTKSSEKITPFGGLNFCLERFHHSGLARLIDRHLGPRVKTTGFSYSEIIANQLAVFFAGGECAEDLSEHLRGPLSQVKGLRPCSPDTLLRGIKELSCESTERIHPTSGVRHTFNINEPLNDMMVKALRGTGQLSEEEDYDLDYDNQVIPTEKWDAARTYKTCYGYQPGIASIDNMPVYIEGRGGNSQATFAQGKTLQRLFARLEVNKVSIDCFRADSASYQKEVVKVVQANTKRFCIRAKRSAEMARQVGQIPVAEWTPITLNWKKMEVAEIPWTPFGGDTSYRLIVTRIKRKDRQGDLFSEGAYTWRAIMSNDHTTSAEQIVAFYNKRGDSERLFDVMNNDFGWSRLPCSFLSENTAFMILMGIIANFYRYILGLYSEGIPWLKATYRLKKFIFRFITVPAKWIRSGRRTILKLYTDKDYTAALE
ncbi:MAG: IS1380 family transposase [Bacteroidetes bacterium]|jgi:hypothetical protein|nr:IS1380 family transposase [Bacteroidota bacterium]